ncbi:rRNA maturation RNase YbeY [Clostridium sp. 'deep sea']|uniref:rRNA maturation RNase YbeY n=1 Tax=Clostridium sp. 'deep sea' TaxID=2779445 RepID=UPI0018966E06|nr:rRNA maturation RNase YbeY [Clostridium sp. 'deep sea']QOR35594.1 rRNA maturation RNase YbeY [Clostridium sp. 'deep sea']
MVEIQILNNQEDVELSADILDELKSTALEIANILNINNKVISIVLANSDIIKTLNCQYRDKDYVTDVLSFPLSAVDSNEEMLGEIIICAKVAKEQAKEYNNNLKQELSFLILHGILHLCGYDHDESHSGEMREKEKEITERLSLKK